MKIRTVGKAAFRHVDQYFFSYAIGTSMRFLWANHLHKTWERIV